MRCQARFDTESTRRKGPTVAVETEEFLAMVGRMIRAAGRRVGEADEVELAALLDLQRTLDEATAAAVRGQRARGESWAYIARATGRTRQAAQMRWGDK
jgi:hypothetical protein